MLEETATPPIMIMGKIAAGVSRPFDLMPTRISGKKRPALASSSCDAQKRRLSVLRLRRRRRRRFVPEDDTCLRGQTARKEGGIFEIRCRIFSTKDTHARSLARSLVVGREGGRRDKLRDVRPSIKKLLGISMRSFDSKVSNEPHIGISFATHTRQTMCSVNNIASSHAASPSP